jgi:coenzyme F420-reducing hydrogenase beta subunit
VNEAIDVKENISILAKTGCYGCGVCVDVCPTLCIGLENDAEGFPYPVVDQPECIDCQWCILSCPGMNDVSRERFLDQPEFYAGYSKDDQVRYQSSSGGFFSPLAEHILAEGGVVYGARYDFDRMTVEHARVDDIAGLPPLRKSKYVQSSTVTIFPQVKKDLAEKRKVLFTGTPCQVEGLHLFLKQDDANLFICDIICHGVPSPVLFQRHFSALQAQRGSAITEIDFRTKAKGWKGPLELYLEVAYGEEHTLTYAPLDAYYALFLSNLVLRPCCYHCKYASTQRRSDLTLGDFWGVKKYHPDLFDGKGTSLILANTEKGKQLLEALAASVHLEQLSTVKPFPPNLTRPTHQPQSRARFFDRVAIEHWHPRRRAAHLLALAVIAWDKTRGVVRRFFTR